MSERSYARGLAAALIAGVLVAWTPRVWAVSVPEAGILLLTLIWSCERLGGWGVWRRNWLLWPLGLIALWGPLQLAAGATVYGFATRNATLSWATNGLFFWIALQSLGSSRNRQMFLSILLAFGCGLAVLAILQNYTAPAKALWLFQTPGATFGPFVYKNQFAAFLEILTPVAVYRVLANRQRALLYACCAAVMTAAVVASASRAGAALVFTEIAVVLLAGYWRETIAARKFAAISLGTFALVAIFVAVAGWESIWIHFQEIKPAQTRVRLLQSTLHMVRDHPVAGVGLGNWRGVYPAYALFDDSRLANEAHNDWAQWAAEGGLPFMCFLTAIFAGSVRNSWRCPWGIGTSAVFLHSMVDYPAREPIIGALLFAMLGATAAAGTVYAGKVHSGNVNPTYDPREAAPAAIIRRRAV
ncbi:MAG: O-antigen ligase family protein [Acidobacteriota bacterium]|nr:O-antigen ligase family protein [Acidobacteriota bacterium]